jgi:opacity protein-like surface antigen
MKKTIMTLLIAALIGGSVFAQGLEMSMGGGGALNMLFSEYKPKGGGDSSKSSTIGGGIFLFFDITYAEIDLDLLFGNQKTDADGDKGTDMTHFGFSVLGKYPFKLSETMALFPLVGIDYQIFMGGKDKNSDMEIKPSDLKDDMAGMLDFFSIAVGLGADFSLSSNLYIRPEFLWNFKLLSKAEDKMKDLYDSQFTSGPRLKIAVGYKFGKPKEKKQQ